MSLEPNCPNCLYCYRIDEKDDCTYKVFCELCGHWLEWFKKDLCCEFIPKAHDAFDDWDPPSKPFH